MKNIIFRIIEFPIIVISALVLFVGFFALHLPQLEFDFSPRIEDNPAWQAYNTTQKIFGSDLFSVVVVQSQHGDMFTEESLALLDNLTSQIKQIEGVSGVESLNTVKHIKGGKGFVRIEKLLHAGRLDEKNLAQLREDVLKNETLVRNLISEDGRTAAINVYVEPTPGPSREGNEHPPGPPQGGKAFDGSPRETERILGEIEGILAGHGQHYEMYQIGRPLLEVAARTKITRALLVFLPLIMLVVSGLLYLYSGNLASFLLPLLTMGVCVLTMFGFMAYMGYPVTSATVAVVLLVLALACSRSWRLLLTYFDEILDGRRTHDALRHTLRHDGFPLCISSLIISVGLATFAFSRIPYIKQFGIVAAFSVIINCLITVLLVPGIGRFFAPPETQKRKKRQIFSLGLGGRVIELYERRRLATSGLLILLFALVCAGISRVRIETPLLHVFKQDAPLSRHLSAVSTQLAGVSTLNIMIDAGRANRMKEPEILGQLDALQHFIEEAAWCDTAHSFANELKLVHREMNGGIKEMEVIPGSRELVSQYLFLLKDVDLGRYINHDYAVANLVVRHHLSTPQELSAALKTIEDYVARHFSADLTVSMTAPELVRDEVNKTVLREQTLFHSLMFMVIFLIVSVLFLSFKVGIAAIIPALLSLLLYLGSIGWFKIPFHSATCILIVLVSGLAVSYIIHFLVRYQERFMVTHDQNLAVGTTIYQEGEPVLLTSAGLMLGFSLFALSGVPLLSSIGLLSGLVIFLTLLNVFFINPRILDVVQIITVWDFIRFELKTRITQASPLFKNLRRSEVKRLILSGNIRKVSPHDFVIRQGEPGREMYLLLTGKVEVYAEEGAHKSVIRTLLPGDLVGEMALLGEPVRSANVMALEETTLLQIDEKSLKRIKAGYPRLAAELFFNISTILSDRLKRQVTDLLQEERTRSELRVARHIQQCLLPSPFPEHPAIHFEGINESARVIGGDFYDYFQIGEHEFAFVIADVCGKGIPAALFMARALSIIKTQARVDPEPLQVVSVANKLIAEESASHGLYVTLFYGVYNTQTRLLHYVNAGHMPPLLFRPSESNCSSLVSTNLAAGMFDFVPFEDAEIVLQQGDVLILYTDGINEANNAEGEQFREERLVQVILEAGQCSPKELQDAIFDRVTTFAEGQEQHDDMTLLIVRV